MGPTYSKECISHQYGHNWVIRWCRFIDNGQGSGADTQTATIGVFNFSGGGDPADTQADGWEIYGNVFACSSDTTQNNMTAQDGLLSCATVNNWKFYNNTITRTGGAWGGAVNISGSDNVARNNLWYRMGYYDADWGSVVNLGVGDEDDSWCFYSQPGSKPARLGADCSWLTGTVTSGSENPFEDWSVLDFRIKDESFSGNSPAGLADVSIAEVYRTDSNGVTHDNIGAFATAGAGSPPPDTYITTSRKFKGLRLRP